MGESRLLHASAAKCQIHRALRLKDARHFAVLTTKTELFYPENTKRVRCVIADDHELVRYGVRRLLEDTPDFVVLAEAGDAAEALKLTLEHQSRPGAARYRHARNVLVRSRHAYRRALPRFASCLSHHA